MDTNNLNTNRPAGEELGNQTVEQAMDVIKETRRQTVVRESAEVLAEGNDITESFAGLPIESLICGPIIAAAKGQQELTAVYVDGIEKLAYKGGDPTKGTNTLDFDMDRPVSRQDGSMDVEKVHISAPILSLVPVPAFTMDELTVDFEMEVKDSKLEESSTQADVSSTVSYKSWFGLSANITGKVSTESSHKRQTDNSATYKIHARAIQQPPSEGMAKLTSLFADMMEPISNSSGK